MTIDLTNRIGSTFKNFAGDIGHILSNDDSDYPIRLLFTNVEGFWTCTKEGRIYSDGRYSILNVATVYTEHGSIYLDQSEIFGPGDPMFKFDPNFVGNVFLSYD